ncbi:MAG TPA: DUF2147 domain-containing protein [Bacteroidales bacterium]|jgi:uncharacterized protein (DUF2147 family)|nr:DUF2147 domain-containing protein [Bacteroidales bacterium]
MNLKLGKNMTPKKSGIILIMLLFITCTSFKYPVSKADEIIGNWLLPDNLEIEIFKKNHKFYGKITEVYGFKDGQEKDIHNPDQSKRNDNLIGKVIISDLLFDSETEQWINGSIYAPQKGLTLELTILKVNGETLEARGSKLFFSKKIIWKRI